LTAKYLFYIIGAVVIIGLVIGAYFYGRKPAITSTVIQPVETQIIERSLPARIEKVYIDNTVYEIARLDTTLTNAEKTATAALKLRYDEKDNLFDIDAKLTSQQKTITIKEKPPFIGLCTGVGVGFQKAGTPGVIGLRSADAEIGVKFVGKYALKAFYSTDNTFGLRASVDW
jgi:hypothetical protein